MKGFYFCLSISVNAVQGDSSNIKASCDVYLLNSLKDYNEESESLYIYEGKFNFSEKPPRLVLFDVTHCNRTYI
jgi:hypothetical protein